jgi:DNA transformation protein
LERDEIEEMFAALGEVTIRRMFGGKGVYRNGLIIAIELRGEMLLKGDATAGPQYEAAGAQRWVYEGKGGKTVPMPYWSAPVDAFDDPEQMARWVRLAYEAAMRSAEAAPAPPRRKRRTAPAEVSRKGPAPRR